MEETRNNGIVGVSGETFEQKVIRNVQGNFAVYKTTEVVGDKSFVPNLEWAEPEDVDKFFSFAKNLGAKVIYITEGEEEDEIANQTKNSMLQVGFIYEGIMHHINFADDEDEDVDIEDEDEDDEEEFEYTPSDIEREEEISQHPQQGSTPESEPKHNLF